MEQTPEYLWITGYDGMAWGTGEAEIVARYGEPDAAQRWYDGRILHYGDLRRGIRESGTGTALGLVVSDEDGLVRSTRSLLSNRDCLIDEFEAMVEETARAYPEIVPEREEPRRPIRCGTGDIGRRSVLWKDPGDGSRIELIYESSGRTYRTWISYSASSFDRLRTRQLERMLAGEELPESK